MTAKIEDFYRVYTPYGRFSHLTTVSTDMGYGAQCGLSPVYGYWLGTGTQREYETAAALPLCKRCAKVVGQ